MKGSNKLFAVAMVLLVASMGLSGVLGYVIIASNTGTSTNSEFTTANLPGYCLNNDVVDLNHLSQSWNNYGGEVSDAGLTFKMTSPGNQGIDSKYIFGGDITFQATVTSFNAVSVTPTPTAPPTPSTTPSPTPTISHTPTPTATNPPTPTSSPTPTISHTPTPTISASPSPTPTPTPTPVPINYGTTGIYLKFGEGNNITMYWTKDASGSYLTMGSILNGVSNNFPTVNLYTSAVRSMKIVRTGSTANFYADIGNGLVKIASINGVLTVPVIPGIYTVSSNSTATRPLKAVYNNLTVKGCYNVVDPSTTSLSDDFSDATLNQSNWDNNNLSAVTLENEQLKFTIPNGGPGAPDVTKSVTSSYMVSGEFDAEVDLANVQTYYLNNGSLELDFDTPLGVHLYIVRYADNMGAHLATDVRAKNGKYVGAQSVDLADASSVRVKIERKGSDLIAYYQTESGYTQLAYYSNITSELGRFTLVAMSRINHPPVTAYADNFSLNGLSDEANAAYCSDLTEAFDSHTGDHWYLANWDTLANGTLTMKRSSVGAYNLASKYIYRGDITAYLTISKFTALTTDDTHLSLESSWDSKNNQVLQWTKIDARTYQLKLYSLNNGNYQEAKVNIPSTTGRAKLMIARRKDVLSMYIDMGDGNGYVKKGSITGVHTLPVLPDLWLNRGQAGQPDLVGVYKDLRIRGCYNVVDTASTNVTDDFSTPTLNRRNWTYYGAMDTDNLVTLNNGKLNMSIPAGSTSDKYIGASSQYLVAGNFSAEVNITSLQANTDQGLAYLEFSGLNNSQVDALWVKGSANTHHLGFNLGTKINTQQAKWEGNDTDLPNASAANGNLWVKIERRGSNFYLSYKTGSDYVLGAVYTNVSSGFGYLKLLTGSQTSHPAVTAAFSSYKLQAIATTNSDLPGTLKTPLDMANGLPASTWERGAGISSDSNGTFYLKADPWLPNSSTSILSKASFSSDFSLAAKVRVISSTKLNPSATDNGHYGVTYLAAYGDDKDNNFMQFRIVRDAISGKTYVDFYGKNNGVLTDSNNVLTDNIQMATLKMNRVGNTVTLYEDGIKVYQVNNVFSGAVRLGVGTNTSSNYSTVSALWSMSVKTH